MVQTPQCLLCEKRGSLKHILSDCTRTLSNGRYCWRRDQLLKEIAGVFDKCFCTSTYKPVSRRINFVKAWGNVRSAPSEKTLLLSTAPDWELFVDLGEQVKFSDYIVQTQLRPDMILVLNIMKQVIMWELTVSWEENRAKSHKRKLTIYQELVEQCKMKGWWAHCDPIEISCRGFMGQSLCKALNKLGLTGKDKRTSIRVITDDAERASRWLWIKRASSWQPNISTEWTIIIFVCFFISTWT